MLASTQDRILSLLLTSQSIDENAQQIKLHGPDQCNEDKFVIMFGLHIEIAALRCIETLWLSLVTKVFSQLCGTLPEQETF